MLRMFTCRDIDALTALLERDEAGNMAEAEHQPVAADWQRMKIVQQSLAHQLGKIGRVGQRRLDQSDEAKSRRRLHQRQRRLDDRAIQMRAEMQEARNRPITLNDMT